MKATRTLLVLLPALVAASAASAPASAQEFSYSPPGTLQAGSAGRSDETVYVPGMRFPIEESPAYANSQVYGRGGSQGGGGSQCDAQNFSYPWWDNYCEPRSWTMPLCPSGTGHQGQDIRAASCTANTHWAVAAENGTITNIGSYSVSLRGESGTLHRYLHMANSSLQVSVGQTVQRGDRMGRVSNEFGGTPTTVHLHYDLQQAVSGLGTVYVPTYMSLVRSYEELLGTPAEPCQLLGPEGGTIDNTSRCFAKFGNAQYWRPVTDAGFGGDLFWTNGFTGANPSNWARWGVALEEAGRYRVSVYITAAYANSTRTRYAVRHAGVEDTQVIDISALPDGWHPLGEFAFAAGQDQWVAVYDNTGETSADMPKIPADAVRLERLDLPVEEPDAGAPDAAPDDAETPQQDADTPQQDAATPDQPDADSSRPDAGPLPDSGIDDKDEDTGGGGNAVQVASKGVCAVAPGERNPLTGAALLGLLGLLLLRRRG